MFKQFWWNPSFFINKFSGYKIFTHPYFMFIICYNFLSFLILSTKSVYIFNIVNHAYYMRTTSFDATFCAYQTL